MHRAASAGCILVLALAVGCSAYQPDSLLFRYNQESQTVGCLDVAVEPLTQDPLAEGPAAKIYVGNRCNTAVVVDYPAIRATVHYLGGAIGRSRVYDPDNTLRPVTLDALRSGWEAFEYHPVDPGYDSQIPNTLCLDVGYIDHGLPTPESVTLCVEVDARHMLTSEVQP